MMPDTHDLKALFEALGPDNWRTSKPFSDDMKLVHDIFYYPFPDNGHCAATLSLWLQRNQPCLFGRIAARDYMQYCFIREKDILESDQCVSGIIREGLLAWKRRSFRPRAEFSMPAHGFMVLVLSPRVAFACPDSNLRRFAERIRSLWGCALTDTPQGTVHVESLYLENPVTQDILKFTFSVDFFAAQGDGRWWQDHRIPGGIAFTANSIGHLQKYREWYQKKEGQAEWILKTAMGTIDLAAQTPYGRATWLRELSHGKPVVERLECPFKNPTALKPELQNKDWTRYGGHLHTDHSIRSEFFDERPEKSLSVQQKEYLQDFAYLYDLSATDFIRFVSGENVARQQVYAEIGDPETYIDIVGPRKGMDEAEPLPRDLMELISKTHIWGLDHDEVIAMD